MTIKEFISFAKQCKTKAELSSIAKSNGLIFKSKDLDNLLKKIKNSKELDDDILESAAGGDASIYGRNIDDIVK